MADNWNRYDAIKIEYKAILPKSLQTVTSNYFESKNKSFGRTDLDLKACLDQAFREYLLELFDKETQPNILQELVLLSIETCRKGLTNPTMPVVLLGDIFDVLTLDLCEQMFTFVEEQVNIWKEELFFISCKNNLLRMCNDLLRRLSRSTATIFCGRILLFLAKFFPFSERSGLNIVSEFNLENVTEYGGDATEDSFAEKSVPGLEKNIVIDYSLYCKFWSLQDFFRNPNQCYNKVQWKLFCMHATSIINTFQGLKVDYVSNKEQHEICGKYFSKYLTNQKLLDLQIYDVNFRRFVLLQFLILFQYLTSVVKFKADNCELKLDQKEWINTVIEKVYALLRETPPDGAKFGEIIKDILQREENWNIWKNDGCPEIRRSITNAETPEKTRKLTDRASVGDLIKEAHDNGKYYMGSPELTKIWNLCPDNLTACKMKDRNFLPLLETYFADAIDQLESPVPIPDEENLLKDGNFGWRALRLLSQRSPHFFTYNNNPINQLPDYLEMMVRKLASERPGRVVAETSEQNDNELEEELFKAGEEETGNEEMKQAEGEEFGDDDNPRPTAANVTVGQLELFSQVIADNWRKLATKLGYNQDEITFFESKNTDPCEQAKHVLHLWFEDDDDATLENFAYILEGLEMDEAAEVVKGELNATES